jgi:hypothetical protein
MRGAGDRHFQHYITRNITTEHRHRCPCGHTSYHEDMGTEGYFMCILTVGITWCFMLQEPLAGEKTSPALLAQSLSRITFQPFSPQSGTVMTELSVLTVLLGHRIQGGYDNLAWTEVDTTCIIILEWQYSEGNYLETEEMGT